MYHGGQCWVSDQDHPNYDAGRRATETVYGTPPDMTREGGSIPITLVLQVTCSHYSGLAGSTVFPSRYFYIMGTVFSSLWSSRHCLLITIVLWVLCSQHDCPVGTVFTSHWSCGYCVHITLVLLVLCSHNDGLVCTLTITMVLCVLLPSR